MEAAGYELGLYRGDDAPLVKSFAAAECNDPERSESERDHYCSPEQLQLNAA